MGLASYNGLKDGGRFLIVIGDSLMAGVNTPTDLIVDKMGKDAGFEIEGIEVAR